MASEFRDIEGFPGYRVGSDGVVWSRRGRGGHAREWFALKPNVVDGYLKVGLYRGGKRHDRAVHVLILEAFVGKRPEGCQALHHPNPDRADCRLENLRWGTSTENHNDQWAHGTMPVGESVHNAKLTQPQVEEIRSSYRRRSVPLSSFAKRFGVSIQSVWRVLHRKQWKHVG